MTKRGNPLWDMVGEEDLHVRRSGILEYSVVMRAQFTVWFSTTYVETQEEGS